MAAIKTFIQGRIKWFWAILFIFRFVHRLTSKLILNFLPFSPQSRSWHHYHPLPKASIYMEMLVCHFKKFDDNVSDEEKNSPCLWVSSHHHPRHREDHAHGHVLLLCGDPSQKESPLQWLHVGHPWKSVPCLLLWPPHFYFILCLSLLFSLLSQSAPRKLFSIIRAGEAAASVSIVLVPGFADAGVL